jgi:hypothetical protein
MADMDEGRISGQGQNTRQAIHEQCERPTQNKGAIKRSRDGDRIATNREPFASGIPAALVIQRMQKHSP